MKLVLCLALAVVGVSAKCESNCNSNGVCGNNDKCICYDGFQGVACQERTCQRGHPWVGDHSTYTECSSKGVCNRKEGTCDCEDGFEGTACQRMSCANDCSGHGQCLTQSYFHTDSSGWDQEMIQGCQCDPGFTGLDCSERLCPVGDDPLTMTNVNDQIQRITVSNLDSSADQQLVISFTSKATSETFSTWALSIPDLSATSIKEALEALPDKVIPTVDVTESSSGVFDVTFIDQMNSGSQNMLSIDVAACLDHGCKTISYGAVGTTSVTIAESQAAGSDSEGVTCSNRGTCDTESGLCVCNAGFKGSSCNKQSTYV